MARALLRNSKIVIMDEATSNLDRETEMLMQQSLAKTFCKSTVITIAHRLDTIIDYDVIIVMGKGRILECGTPQTLARQGGGEFAKMLKSANLL